MDFLKKLKNLNFEKTKWNEKLLHNTYVLYFMAFLSFGKFFFEMMTGNMYYVAVYMIIAFLLSFFNKNMIVILFFSLIFANILKYGNEFTIDEGFENDEPNEVDKALGIENKIDDEGIMDEILEEDKEKEKEKKEKKKKEKKEKKEKDEESDLESDDESEIEEKKKSKKKRHQDDYEESEKLLKNQELLLQNMREYKPFLDTIQGLAKNMSGLVKKDSEKESE
jgi:hypothetical protein